MASNRFELILRWENAEPAHLPLLRQLAPDAIVSSKDVTGFKTLRPDSLGPVITDGLWPGIRRPASRAAREAEVASASAEPWVDSNGYLVAFHRALNPGHPVTLAYRADEKAGVKPDVEIPNATVELALVEASVAGGNFVLDLPVRYREQLLSNEPKAVGAWKNLAQTAAWLKANSSLFGHPALKSITALVEPGMQTREIANLLHRRGASPFLSNAADPLSSTHSSSAIVAAGLKQVPSDCYSLAEAGSILVIDQPPSVQATPLRQEADRKFFSHGKGTIVAYNRRIIDPSEFAMDVIDLITHKRRATRLWNAQSTIPLATSGERPGEALLHVINYGSGAREEIQAHIQGHFAKATLLCPDRPELNLKTARRGPSTEVFLPNLQRMATVRFSN